MSRIGYHFMRTGTNDGSMLFIVIGIVIFVGYFIFKNWDNISSSKLISESTVDLSNPKFTKRDTDLLFNTQYNYFKLVQEGVFNDIHDIKHRLNTSLMHRELKTVSERELQQFYDCYVEIQGAFEELLGALYDAKQRRAMLKVADVVRESQECTEIIRKRVEPVLGHKLY